MSDPNESVPSLQATAPEVPAAAPPPPATPPPGAPPLHAAPPPAASAPAGSALVPAGPYRVPPGQAPSFEPYARAAGSRPWPILGPAVSVFAVLLWSFVVAGQFTTSWMSGGPLPPAIAAAVVLLTTFAAWIAGVRRGVLAAPPRTTTHLVGRAIATALLAFVFFVLAVFAATVAGGVSSTNHDFLLALGLVVVSLVAAVVGPTWTWPSRPAGTAGQRRVSTALWLAGAVVTVVAGAELLLNG
ncbi:MAG: hypothetical protein KF764_03445 [Labilithrix sp.]|nr:hypothetical protein [Labilithrix sp.]